MEVFNAGHNKPVRVVGPVETILGLCGQTQPCPVIRGDGNSHAENDRQWMDGAKVKRILG